uniref:Metal-dependent hydrolase n=1 Tax=uncultured bacterium A1Q1_fos_15 TaxID=1256548 RepID=L7VZB2_9BACT|nr:metal-dependent hydrolase [uncultured bacterium A1Q1_fos_15]
MATATEERHPHTASRPATASGRPSATRTFPVRKVSVDYDKYAEAHSTGEQAWLVDNDPIFSSLLATLSAAFPNGEDFFVASVRRHRHVVEDNPYLKAQVRAFIGQEALHGREHRELNARLEALGYPTERTAERISRACDRILAMKPKTLALAVTAAAEHFTGIFAEAAIGDEMTREVLFADPELQRLITWHALEELEHKNVAFDVLTAAGGRYPIRALGMIVCIVMLASIITVDSAKGSIDRRDQITRSHRRQHLRNLRRQRLLSGWSLRKLLTYFKPGFHPDDTDTDALVDEWRVRLEPHTRIVSSA